MYFALIFSYHFHLFIVLGGGTCGIYKSSYNISKISYLNLPPPPFSFFYCSIIIFSFFTVVLEVHCSIYKSSYNISDLNSLFSSFSFIPLSIVSIGHIFPFMYMCTTYLYHIHPVTLFRRLLPAPTGINPPDRTCSTLLFSDFIKEKDDIFISLKYLYREFPCDISIFLCVITQTGSFPLFFSFLL
jgi:hypothetical protein